jgi:hypothetical protein
MAPQEGQTGEMNMHKHYWSGNLKREGHFREFEDSNIIRAFEEWNINL